MKANRAIRNDRAEVGVGTLIVFIAMVLVAAVAAAVLINTTGTLQQRAQATGKEATQEVSSNLKVVNVFGKVTAAKVDQIRINVQLAAGALPMDLEKTIIRYSDGVNTFNYVWTPAYSDATVPATCEPDEAATETVDTATAANVEAKFISLWLRPTPTNTNDHGCLGTSVMKAGDLVEFRFSLDDSPDHRLAVRKDAQISLIPESGSSVSADFTTPPTYGSATYVTLR